MLAGCYKPEAGDCSYRCPEGACPVGLTCDGNGLCREPGKAGTPCAATDDAATCAMGEMSCGGTCTNVATDPLNCGTCGRACPCADGKCSVEMVHSGLYAPGVLAAGFGYVVFTEGKFTQSNALCSAPDAQIRLMESATKNEPYMIPIPTPGQCPGAIAVANDAFYVGRLGSVTRYTFGSTAEAGFVDTNSHYVGGIGVTPTWVFFGTHGSFQVFRSPRALSNMKTSIQ